MWDLLLAFANNFSDKPTVVDLLISMRDDRRVDRGKRAKNPIELKIASIAALHLE